MTTREKNEIPVIYSIKVTLSQPQHLLWVQAKLQYILSWYSDPVIPAHKGTTHVEVLPSYIIQ